MESILTFIPTELKVTDIIIDILTYDHFYVRISVSGRFKGFNERISFMQLEHFFKDIIHISTDRERHSMMKFRYKL